MKIKNKLCENEKCKKSYTPKSRGQKYCCDNCRSKHYHFKNSKRCPEVIEVLKYKCAVCGENATGFFNCKAYCEKHYIAKVSERKGPRSKKQILRRRKNAI